MTNFGFQSDLFWRLFFGVDQLDREADFSARDLEVVETLKPLLDAAEVALPDGVLTPAALRLLCEWFTERDDLRVIELVRRTRGHDLAQRFRQCITRRVRDRDALAHEQDRGRGAARVQLGAHYEAVARFIVSELRNVVLWPANGDPWLMSFSPFAWRNHLRRSLVSRAVVRRQDEVTSRGLRLVLVMNGMVSE